MTRILLQHPDIFTLVHVNDLGSAESTAYLLKYDSVHGEPPAVGPGALPSQQYWHAPLLATAPPPLPAPLTHPRAWAASASQAPGTRT